VIKTSVDKHFSTKEFLRYNEDKDEIVFTTEPKKGVKNHRVLTFEQGKLWFKLKPESPKSVNKDQEKKESHPESADNRNKNTKKHPPP